MAMRSMKMETFWQITKECEKWILELYNGRANQPSNEKINRMLKLANSPTVYFLVDFLESKNEY